MPFLELVCFYWKKYPLRSLSVAVGMIISGLFEGIGIATVLPLLALVVDGGGGVDTEHYGQLERVFAGLGLPFEFEIMLIVIGIALLLKTLIKLGIGIHMEYSGQLIGRDNRAELIKAMSGARWRYFTKKPSGIFANLASFEADRAAGSFGSMHKFTDAGWRLLITFAIGTYLSPVPMILGATLGVVSVAVLRPLIRMARTAGTDEAITLRHLISDLTQTSFIFKPLKAMGSEKRFLNMIGSLNQELNKARRLAILSKKVLEASQELIILSILALGLFIGFKVLDVPLSEMMFTALLLVRIQNHIGEIQKRYQSIANTHPIFTQIRATLEEIQGEKEVWPGTQPVPANMKIAFQNVRFSHDANIVLHDVSLIIPAKQFTLITGPSGAGKTTIIDLLCGFHIPDDGEILIDTTNLASLNIRAWRQGIGYLPQTPTLLNQSVRDNITYFDDNISGQQVEDAVKMAGAWDFVSELPQGIDTIVGERGGKFSGGQQQRIALARALVHKPKLLILDEPTASLDQNTERLICEQLQTIKGQMTIVAISHQLALGRVADLIYRLEDGYISTETVPTKETFLAT